MDSAWSMKPERQVSMPGRWPWLRPNSANCPSGDSTIMMACRDEIFVWGRPCEP